MKRFVFCCGILFLLSAQRASADMISPTEGGYFIAGSGIPSDGFTINTAGTGESVGLKARSRDTGYPISMSGNVYHVLTGLSADAAHPWWSFDFQFSPGLTGSTTPSDYVLHLHVDFNPAVVAPDFSNIDAPVGLLWFDGTDGYLINPGGTAWSDATPYVVSNSAHLGFALWGKPYDPNATGQYEIDLFVTRGDSVVASTSILVQVDAAPEPSTLALLSAGAGVFLFMSLRRRQRKLAH